MRCITRGSGFLLMSVENMTSEVKICVPNTAVFQRHQDQVLPLAGAITFKEVSDETFGGRARFLETSLNLVDADFAAALTPFKSQLDSTFASFSCDLGPNCKGWSLGKSTNGFPRYLPHGEVAGVDELVQRAVDNADYVRRFFGGVIKVENLNYFPTGAYEEVCIPEVITQVVEAADIELLLDVGHAVISAHNLDLDVGAYLDVLPLHRVSEIHLSRPGIVGGLWEDLHELPSDEELTLLERIGLRAPLQFATIEYYREAGFVKGQRLLYDWCKRWSEEGAISNRG